MESDHIKDLIGFRLAQVPTEDTYANIGLKFNPFPRSGIADLNSASEVILQLSPIELDVKEKIAEYVVDSLFPNNPNSDDNYLSVVIRGDYGYGKTQTLLYSKYLIEYFKTEKKFHRNPYVVYIDNPGGRLTELIGSIISQIGEENFKRYIWNIIFEDLKKSSNYKDELFEIFGLKNSMYNLDEFIDPFNNKYIVSYKKFVDNLYSFAGKDIKRRKAVGDKLKEIIISTLNSKVENQVVASFFYELLSENIGVSKIWDAITSGHLKELDKKEVYLIRAIVKLLNQQGFTNFYILIDEFEAITASGRLTPSETERYISNLRALIDKERSWCSIFAMTGLAFTKLKSLSPPLADRIGGRIVDLKPLSDNTANQLILNYLNLARDQSDSLYPFSAEAISELNTLSNGILRIFLKSCYAIIQRAIERSKIEITPEFINKFFEHEDEE